MHNFEITYKGNLSTEAVHLKSGTVITTDAPTDNHGKGESFSPTDLASTSLAACMLTIMGISGREHGFSIDGTKAEVTKIMDSNPRRIKEVKVKLIFPNNDYSDKHKRIIEHISRNCPVALSLHGDVEQTIEINF